MLVLASNITTITKETSKGKDLSALIVGRQGIHWINVIGCMDFLQALNSRTNPWLIKFLAIK